MAGKKDAAWWREYRERKRLEQQQSKGLRDPAEGVAVDTSTTPSTVSTPSAWTRQPDGSSAYNVAAAAGMLPVERVDIDKETQDVRHYDADGNLLRTITYAERLAAGAVIAPPVAHRTPRPTFLAAPDDDCMSCGHDRQQYHTGTPYCLAPAPYARGAVCRCPAFVDAAEPF